MIGKYSVELFREGGEGRSIERILVRRDDLTTARALYRVAAGFLQVDLTAHARQCANAATHDREGRPVGRRD
jgi:hypothetical protein